MTLSKPEKLWMLGRKIRFLKYSRNRIEKIQLQKLKAIIAHAYATVPYYRDLFSRHHLKPDDINSFKDLTKIPLTSKKDIIGLDRTQITSDTFQPDSMDEIRTSGSTGEPFKFYSDKAYGEIVGLDCLRSKFSHGMKPTDRIMRLGGDVTSLAPPGNVLKRTFLRKATLSSFEKPEDVLEFYSRFRPDVIRGFISILYVFALWIEDQGIRLDHVPRFILCSAEMAHDFMKEKVSEVFRSRVIDRYATAELGVVADNCDDGTGYHVFEDSVYAELIELCGEIYFVGTCLDNFATPFIRFNTGDICEPWPDRPGRCPCGQNTVKFKRIKGRDNDFIRTPDGSLLSPMEFIFLMRKKYDLVKKYRFIQMDDRSIQAEIVPGPGFDKPAIGQIIADLKILTGGLEPTVRILDCLCPEPSGKMRIVKSHVIGAYRYAD